MRPLSAEPVPVATAIRRKSHREISIFGLLFGGGTLIRKKEHAGKQDDFHNG